MKYVLFYVCLALLSQYVSGYLIVQDDHSSSEGDHELGLKQRMDHLKAKVAKLQANMDHHINCTVDVRFWLGLTDTETEGTWRWYDNGLKATYLSWGGSEPQDYGSEDCAVYHGGLRFEWGDVPCGDGHRALCEQANKSR